MKERVTLLSDMAQNFMPSVLYMPCRQEELISLLSVCEKRAWVWHFVTVFYFTGQLTCSEGLTILVNLHVFQSKSAKKYNVGQGHKTSQSQVKHVRFLIVSGPKTTACDIFFYPEWVTEVLCSCYDKDKIHVLIKLMQSGKN